MASSFQSISLKVSISVRFTFFGLVSILFLFLCGLKAGEKLLAGFVGVNHLLLYGLFILLSSSFYYIIGFWCCSSFLICRCPFLCCVLVRVLAFFFSAFNDCVKRCIRSVSYYFLLPASSSLSSIPTSTTLPTITPSTCMFYSYRTFTFCHFSLLLFLPSSFCSRWLSSSLSPSPCRSCYPSLPVASFLVASGIYPSSLSGKWCSSYCTRLLDPLRNIGLATTFEFIFWLRTFTFRWSHVSPLPLQRIVNTASLMLRNNSTILRDDRLLSPLFQRHSHFNTTTRRIRTFCSFASPFIQFLFTFNSFLLLVARIHICL